MTVSWLTTFIDMAASTFTAGCEFWRAVTNSAVSPVRGDTGEFATLLPPDGDAYLKVQRVGDPVGRIHLDFHVDVAAMTDTALRLGATLVQAGSYNVMRSPGGLTFCLVSHKVEGIRPKPVMSGGLAHLVDQVCIDVPDPLFDAEVAFWAAFTGWEAHAGSLGEFVALTRPAGMPIRLLLQRLGVDDSGTTARAHLDVACGPNVGALTEHYVGLGARVEREEAYWTTLTDPTGAHFCLTSRDPITGTRPA